MGTDVVSSAGLKVVTVGATPSAKKFPDAASDVLLTQGLTYTLKRSTLIDGKVNVKVEKNSSELTLE
jgi:hypothetical protein